MQLLDPLVKDWKVSMSRTNEVKAAQLGMPLGTAVARLRKKIVFSFAQRLGEDICFKCGLRIERIEHFTVEHKKPWLHVDVNLFWDLTNIAFSHSWCNRPDRPNYEFLVKYSKEKRIQSPKGMNWCNRHKKFLSVELFSKNITHWTGLQTICKECENFTRDKVPLPTTD
jgi:hypothetical protein